MSVEVVTFGCRLNLVESEAIRHAADHQDDLVVFNTCAVTNEAVRQARQAIRRMGRERPHATLVVTGCAAQIDPQGFADMPEVSRVVGNADKTKPATWIVNWSVEGLPRATVNDVMALPESAHHFVTAGLIAGHTRGFVEVQNGCDHRCTFCIIPYGRGPSRSAAMGDVVTQIARLVENGAREVVLTGVDMTSWGHDLPGTPSLGKLVQAVLRHVPDLPRLRLSSIDCIEVDEPLREAIASEPRFMPHLHLSLQAGDDMILKRMKRRHSRDDAIAFCNDTRAARPDMVFGCDLIAGFPTETEAMFQRTLDLVEDCGLTHLHVFPFSARIGTPAARMPAVDGALVRERAARLREAGVRRLRLHLDAQNGRTLRVLGERGGVGHAEDFTPVRVGDEAQGRVVEVLVSGHDGVALTV